MTPQETAQRASAELVIVSDAFARMRLNATEALFASKAGEDDLREALYRSVQTIDAVERHLKDAIDTGAIEDFAEQVRSDLRI
jgi:hypothetical protein